MIRKLFSSIHKILGIPLSIIFLIWFLSGIAMIWHSFPRRAQPLSQQTLTFTELSVDSILNLLPDDSAEIHSISIACLYGHDAVKIEAADSSYNFYLDTLEPVGPFKESHRAEVLKYWCNAPVARIDTLTDVDQWIPFDRWMEKMPIYKYYFDDPAGHQLYMTTDGDVIQFTSKSDRRWAWISGIPHWLYFTPLRRNQQLWTDVVIWAALFGCIMCLTGIIVAIMTWWNHRKINGVWHSPYRKFWWKWHFILGLMFGWCAITFAFSGYMSMADLPSFLKKENPAERIAGNGHQRGNRKGIREGRRGSFGKRRMAPTDAYLLPANEILKSDSVVSISWEAWNGHPYYRVCYKNSIRNIDAAICGSLSDFTLTEEMVMEDSKRQLPDSIQRTVKFINEYDDDYYSRKTDRALLPVYKVSADDYMHTVIYYDPVKLTSRKVDDYSRTRRFLYSGLHSLNIKLFTDRPWLWYSVMLILLCGGSLLSVTGLVLALQWLRRNLFHRFIRK